MWHFDMDGYVLGKAIQTPVEDLPFSVNFLDFDGKELTVKFATKENAKGFIDSMNPARFVECNFVLEEET